MHTSTAGSTPHTEGTLDEWKGKLIAVGIVRPDYNDGNEEDDYAYNQTMWSSNDGGSWSAPITLSNVVNGYSYNCASDPGAVFTDGGKA